MIADIFMGLVGLLVAGEALALMVGIWWIQGRQSNWISWKNDAFLVTDIVIGLGLLLGTVFPGRVGNMETQGLLISGVFTHLWRNLDYLIGDENRFCFNGPLLVLNNVKLVGLSLILLAGI